jgi:hypothetical protein
MSKSNKPSQVIIINDITNGEYICCRCSLHREIDYVIDEALRIREHLSYHKAKGDIVDDEMEDKVDDLLLDMYGADIDEGDI